MRTIALIALGALLAACSGQMANSNASISGPLVANPSSVQFSIAQFLPPAQPVQLTKANGTSGPFSLSVANPTVVGASSPVSSGGSASFSVFPIAAGSTSITVADASGASVTVTAATSACGRPDNLGPSQMVFPKPGATGVATSIGKIYFGVLSVLAPKQTNLHLIAGQNGTLEGGTLHPDTPPPGSGSVTPTPQYPTVTYMSATVPALQAETNYRTQIYDDACQPANLTGAFTTS